MSFQPLGTGQDVEEIPIDYTSEWEQSLSASAKALAQIAGALTSRSFDPPKALFEFGGAVLGHVRFRAERIILTNTDAATQTFTLTVGTRIFRWRVPTTNSLDLPFPYVLDRGVDATLTTTGGAGTATGYLTGYQDD